ncbi:MAG TPA: 3-oxoacyl-[acyl-carrier-protein] synthase III C-terminal domain-containing protein [Roseimicrobium sp.]|nr:3-oxoacyl-[acyl-carrier-protein] synthase III C-terminal domain-containing protein [Roseimicrobium sp.]
MFITGLGTAVPPRRYSQLECWEGIQGSPQFGLLKPRSQSILRKVLQADNGISTRHLGVEPLSAAFDLTPDVLHARFVEQAPLLSAQAASKALQQAGLGASDIDGLIISTCTGYLCPGLTSYVSERLGLRRDVFCVDLVGQGCGAAIPNLRSAAAMIKGQGANHVLSVCVEVCSAALYLDDDAGVLISACLFADGAGAAVVSASPSPGVRKVRITDFGTVLKPALRDELRFEQRNGMLRNILRPSVPALAAAAVEEVLNDVLDGSTRTQSDIRAWILHAGGRDVLIALRERLHLTEHAVRHSTAVLRDYGNVSSPCVFFVLDATLKEGAPSGLWWMSSFGAGFSCHGVALEVE